MMRSLSVATLFAAALALPAMAEDTKTKIDPGTAGPTSTMTDAVPTMKRDAEAIKGAGADSTKPLPSSKAMGEAVPSMRPGDGVSGHSDGKSTADAKPAAAKMGTSASLTEEAALTWIDKPVYSSDGKELGNVAAFQHDADHRLVGMHADIGGFLGLGETRIALSPDLFKLEGDRVVLGLTASEAKALPAVQK